MISLPPKQQATLDAIREYRRRTGLSPTMRELADSLGVSKVTVFEHVNNLETKGLIRRSKFKSRSIEVVGEASERRRLVLPVLGWIGSKEGTKA